MSVDRTLRAAITALHDLAFPELDPPAPGAIHDRDHNNLDSHRESVGVWEAEDAVAAAVAAEPLWGSHPGCTVVVETASGTEPEAAAQLAALQHALGQPDGWVCNYAKVRPLRREQTVWLAQTQWLQITPVVATVEAAG